MSVFEIVIDFLQKLDDSKVSYTLAHVRDSLMVIVYAARGYCEVEFFPDGTIEVEWFNRSDGPQSVDRTWLDGFVESEGR